MTVRGTFFSGASLTVALIASTAAMADCTPTNPAIAKFAPVISFSGGSINALTSAINTANTAFLTQSSAFISAPSNPAPNQEGGGVWARGIGGEITTKSSTTTNNISLAGIGITGTINCNSQTKLSFAGAQVGTDTSILNYGGWNMHVGTTVGYLEARSRDISGPGAVDPQGGTFRDSLQVPFAGVYAALTKGGFFLDGQIRAEYYQNTLNDPFQSGIFNQKVDARGLSFTANVGYNQALQNNWFIEPSAGVVVSKVKVDPFNATGTLLLPAGSFAPPGTFPGQLRVDDINSTLGRLSLRTGTTVTSGNLILQPFAIASVYHEFDGRVTSNFDSVAFQNTAAALGVALPSLGAGSTSSTGIGTYGQFGLGVAGQVANTGLLGYLRGDYRIGDKIEGYSINGGLRYQFSPERMSTPMYAKAPAPMQQAYNWNGFFVGGSFGVLNGQDDDRITITGGTTNPRFAGALGGGQVGYDYQAGRWVVGIEGSANATNARGARGCPAPADSIATCEAGVDWIGTATARLGYTFWNRSLFYVRGGGAFSESKLAVNCNTGTFNPFGVTNCGQSASVSRTGYTLGFGSEFALTRNWTVRSETNYFDMGTKNVLVPGTLGFAATNVEVREKGFLTTVGVNYRFNAGPVVARY